MKDNRVFPATVLVVVTILLAMGIAFTYFPILPKSWTAVADYTHPYAVGYPVSNYGEGFIEVGHPSSVSPGWSDDVLYYNPTTDLWSNLGQVPWDCGFQGSATFGLSDGSAVISGGTCSFNKTAQSPQYQLVTDKDYLLSAGTYYILPDIPHMTPTPPVNPSPNYIGVGGHQIAIHGNYLYSFGGTWYQPTGVAGVEAFVLKVDATTGNQQEPWTQLGDLPKYRMGGSLITVGDYAYWFGGKTYEQQPSPNWYDTYEVWRYDFINDLWLTITNMPTYSGCADNVAAYANQIYISGGVGFSPTLPTQDIVQIYDIATATWSVTTPLPEPLKYDHAVVVGDNLYVGGGQQGTSPSTSNVDQWGLILSKTAPIAVVDGTKYIWQNHTLVSFDGSSSYDTDGTIMNYTWNFGDGTVGYGATTSHNYTVLQNYSYFLTVTDDDALTHTTGDLVMYTPQGIPILPTEPEPTPEPSIVIPQNLWFVTVLLALVAVGGYAYGYYTYPKRSRTWAGILWATPSLAYGAMLISLAVEKDASWLYPSGTLQIIVILLPIILWANVVAGHWLSRKRKAATETPKKAQIAQVAYGYRRRRGGRRG